MQKPSITRAINRTVKKLSKFSITDHHEKLQQVFSNPKIIHILDLSISKLPNIEEPKTQKLKPFYNTNGSIFELTGLLIGSPVKSLPFYFINSNYSIAIDSIDSYSGPNVNQTQFDVLFNLLSETIETARVRHYSLTRPVPKPIRNFWQYNEDCFQCGLSFYDKGLRKAELKSQICRGRSSTLLRNSSLSEMKKIVTEQNIPLPSEIKANNDNYNKRKNSIKKAYQKIKNPHRKNSNSVTQSPTSPTITDSLPDFILPDLIFKNCDDCGFNFCKRCIFEHVSKLGTLARKSAVMYNSGKGDANDRTRFYCKICLEFVQKVS